ncbi:MAG: vanadium-dependent haloperoxidase [Burkholderiaceae bacterium]|nr:vanadium-dependent haloperoxidase [Burkholderiaceae bacterium]
MNGKTKHPQWAALIFAASLIASPVASADAVCDWNIKAGDLVVSARMGPPPANRAMAIANTAVYEAVNAITKRYPAGALKLEAAPGASVDAAIAAANRTALAKLLPSQQAAIDSAYQAALAKIADGAAKTSGIAVGEQAAAAILASRADDGAAAGETYRPQTAAGVYVPTVLPAVTHWPQRKPWLMTSASQFRPGPPPALTSALWSRDYNEVKALGGKGNSRRSAEQTQIAGFWEATLPPIFNGIVLSIADVPGREVTQNARLFAAIAQAADDALLAVFEAKYHYNFWRPVTAIRNGDLDGNDATERDPSWTPFIESPMHPEYPCAHCIVAAAVGTVLQAEVGTGAMPTLTTSSYLVKGPARNWKKIDDFMQEVGNARVYDGVHFRNSTEVGTAMGKQVGELAVAKFLRRAD